MGQNVREVCNQTWCRLPEESVLVNLLFLVLVNEQVWWGMAENDGTVLCPSREVRSRLKLRKVVPVDVRAF